MQTGKLQAGSSFPEISVPLVTGGRAELHETTGEDRWKLVVVYRGLHCPICARYLETLEGLIEELSELQTDVIAVSGDGLEKVKQQVERGSLTFPVGYDLSINDMKKLGLYISNPRSEKETDRPFPEPGLFVIRPDKTVQILDISNAPFSRPDLKAIVNGLRFVQGNDYPIRGTLE
ncbi:peroxiredoxin-like family protein [Sneathiella limimaris]|uniref:peroxiredoxin-like family protein n=1 Tax=Sneathiella limimaris TaxID=1964213 RepID=UPI00146BDE91|nr:peroxiredoxin-like family protein [Sneathiella limimaris]